MRCNAVQAAWCALFGLPPTYLRCRQVADAIVEEALHAAALLVTTGITAGAMSHTRLI